MNIKSKELSIYITKESFELDYAIDLAEGGELEELVSLFKQNKYKFFMELAFVEENILSISLGFLQYIAREFLQVIANDPRFIFEEEPYDCKINDTIINKICENVPFIIGGEFVNKTWILELLDKFNEIYKDAVLKSEKKPLDYLISKRLPFVIPSRIYFHLVENRDLDQFPFAFLATYTSIINGELVHCPLNNALVQLKYNKSKLKTLIQSIIKASKESKFIKNLVEKGNIFHPIKMNEQEAYTFLKEIAIYESCGIICRVPKWYTENSSSIRIDIEEKHLFSVANVKLICPQMIYKGVAITRDEAEDLLIRSEGLEIIKGKWVVNNHSEIENLLKEFDILSKSGTSLIEILKTRNEFLHLGNEHFIPIEISQHNWITKLFNKQFDVAKGEVKATACFSDVLRPYQFNAFQWMYGMCGLGLGVCLADDMGLGKTIEVLSFIDKLKEEGKDKVLIVVPATLVENWKKEINKFAPHLKYYVLKGGDEPDEVKADITITTYQTVIRLDYINRINWDLVVLDEAQAIKNYYTAQSKKIKALNTEMRIAMTGTPIENNLLELWSLFDFINPGLLGTREEFECFYSKNKKVAQRSLKNLISPFILRRVKTDKTIIADLPEKHEIDVAVDLSKKQIVLSNKIISKLDDKLQTIRSQKQMEALKLVTILQLKQVCNHPSQYWGDEKYELCDSGKFLELERICETIYAKREKVLVFTQFKEIIPALDKLLSKIFGKKGFCIDGETSMKKRNKYIEEFQEGQIPYMILSLKTAGVGLNLTAAQNVIHFDRWWNPAVENQATDRVFRIGQTKNVTVYKLISANSVESAIKFMIEEKQRLANDMINDINVNVENKLSIEEIWGAIKRGCYKGE